MRKITSGRRLRKPNLREKSILATQAAGLLQSRSVRTAGEITKYSYSYSRLCVKLHHIPYEVEMLYKDRYQVMFWVRVSRVSVRVTVRVVTLSIVLSHCYQFVVCLG